MIKQVLYTTFLYFTKSYNILVLLKWQYMLFRAYPENAIETTSPVTLKTRNMIQFITILYTS